MVKLRVVFVLLAAFVWVPLAHAATYIVPTDEELIQTSDDIVVATGVTSLVERNERGAIVTRYTLRIEEVIKGDRSVGQHLVLTERGGVLGDQVKWIPGTPEYVPGERYLVFTETNRDFEPVTRGMGLGQFEFVKGGERPLAVRTDIHGLSATNMEGHVEKPRDAQKFLEYLRAVVRHRASDRNYFLDVPVVEKQESRWRPESLFTRGSYLMVASGKPFRWFTPTATFVKSGTPAGVDGGASVTLSYNQWNGTDSDINYSGNAQDNSAVGGLDAADGKNAILFNDPNGEVSAGVAGIGGITNGGNPYTLDGEDFWRMLEVDVVMNDGSFAQNCYNTVMVHEVGHTLGFRHSNQPPAGGDSTTSAVMNSTVQCSWNGVLKDYDKNAASAVYGNGTPTCTAPSISTQPQNKSIAPAGTTSLTVAATGTATLTYQWFIGAVNTDETAPIGGATSATLSNLSPASTTQYWVKVTNGCGSARSNVATVTVQACTPASISSQPQNKTTTAGQSVRMSVTAAGTGPFSYQWYVGNSGDTSNPIDGATSSSPNLIVNATTTVWVRVTGQCGSPVDSAAATITVSACAPVIVGVPSATGAASNWTLNVSATSLAPGSLTYEWFKGSNPGSGVAPKVGEGQSLAVVVTTVSQYWAKVTNSCGSFAFSELVVVAPCQLPVIATQPADRTILKNTSTQLSVTAGEGVTVQWYRGTAPDKSNPLPTAGATVTAGPLTETTSFWASLTNSCGEVPTRTVVVTVDDSCVLPVITVQPEDRTIFGGATTQLSVGFTGEGVTVQWYEGVSPDTSRPVGTGASITTAPINLSTAFWAKLTNACGEVSTRTVQVRVEGTCQAPVITTQPSAVTVVSPGQTTTLSLIATGTPVLKYQWYEGAVGVTTTPVGTDSPLFTTPPVGATTNYWVRVSNACGSTDSRGSTVLIGGGRRRATRS